MNTIIGRKAIFFRQVPRTKGMGYEQKPYVGTILLIYNGIEKINGKYFNLDLMLVQLDAGGMDNFTPDELSEFVVEKVEENEWPNHLIINTQ